MLIAGFGIFLVKTWLWQGQIADDAYITMRFAKNLAEGKGLVWNNGGERVEGFTSLLHVGLLAASAKADVPLETADLFIGVVSVFGTACLLLWIVRRERRIVSFPAAVMIVFYLLDSTAAHLTALGLETQLFVFLLCACYATALTFLDRPGPVAGVALALLVFLSVTCRPDGVLYGAAIYAVLALYMLLRDQRGLRWLLQSVLLLAILGLAYAVAKYQYFGYLLPNPFYVKSNQFSLDGASFVVKYVAHIIVWLGPVLFGFAWFSSPAALLAPVRDAKIAAKVALTLGPALLALGYYTTITHEVGGFHRFSYPTYFYLVVAAAIFADLAARGQSGSFHPARVAVLGLLGLALVLGLEDNWRSLRPPFTPQPRDAFNEYHFKIARSLRETGLGSRATILCDAAGIIPLVSGFNQLDRVGLTNNYLSGRQPLTPEQREDYIWSRKPDVYVGFEPPASAGAHGPEDDPRMQSPYMVNLMRFHSGGGAVVIENRTFLTDPKVWYKRMCELRDNWLWLGEIEWPGWQASRLKSFVYVRKDTPYLDRLVPALQKIVVREPAQVELTLSSPSGLIARSVVRSAN
jgi:hypothetical protein